MRKMIFNDIYCAKSLLKEKVKSLSIVLFVCRKNIPGNCLISFSINFWCRLVWFLDSTVNFALNFGMNILVSK